MKKCSVCGADNPDNVNSCRECAAPLKGSHDNKGNIDVLKKPLPVAGQNYGVSSTVQQNISTGVYETQVSKYLHAKDGNVHILMINSFSKWINQVFGVESKYTIQIDNIISLMQKNGYEIVDIKFSTEQNQGLFKEMEGFYTLIMYK